MKRKSFDKTGIAVMYCTVELALLFGNSFSLSFERSSRIHYQNYSIDSCLSRFFSQDI